MDMTWSSLRQIRSRVVVPHSIPGLVTNRVLTMTYLQGVPLTKLEGHLTEVPQHLRKAAFRKVCSTRYSCIRSIWKGLWGFYLHLVIHQPHSKRSVPSRSSAMHQRLMVE